MNVAVSVTLQNAEEITGGLRRLLDLLADKPEVGHAALVRCGLKLRWSRGLRTAGDSGSSGVWISAASPEVA